MSSEKRRIWLQIYNDYLDRGNRKELSEAWKSQLDSVVTTKDFYELFRNWEDKKLPQRIQDLKRELNMRPEDVQERLRQEHIDIYGKERQIS